MADISEDGILQALKSRIDRSAPEDNEILKSIYLLLRSKCGLFMPLQDMVNSTSYPNSFLKNPNVSIMANCIISEDTEIGEYSYVGWNTHITRAKIGRYCSIGNNVSIGPGEHPTSQISTSSYFLENMYEKLTSEDCEIGHDVWIGADAIIRRGVKIGNGAVIGANSFVNNDVSPFAIVAGSPAKFIKFRHAEQVIREISDSDWWDKDLQSARQIIKDLMAKLDLS